MTQGDITADEARRRLYELMDRDEPFETKAQNVLELGVAYLGVTTGYIAKIDPQTNYWETLFSTDSDDGQFPAGLVCNLQEMYCRKTIQQDTSIAVHDAAAAGWENDAAFEALGVCCYHGTIIELNDETYGTVCFVSESAGEPFTDGDTMFAELIARLLEQELERKRCEAELTRQSNLSNVLNRVLRHNLRNSVAVIRGRAELLAKQCPEETHTQSIIEHADRLITLGEKARSLESVIASNHTRQEVTLRSVLDRVAQTVESEYPAASITVDCQDDVTVAVQPSFETALHELIENAAEHTGDCPTVTISATPVTDGIQVQITDDGPGLAESELSTLIDGTETQLSHGSGLGLWLAYWVVTGHDGTIDATTSTDGTQLTIHIPRQAASTLDDWDENLSGTEDGDWNDNRNENRNESEIASGSGSSNTEPTLERVHSKFRAVFEESSDAMLLANDDGQYIDANQAAGELFGLSAERLLGRSIEEFTPEEFDFEAAWQDFHSSGSSRGTIPLVRPDGTQCTVEYAAKSSVVPGQHLTILRDVTEREARKRERQLAETVFENVQDAVFLIDVVDEQEFRVQRVNKAYQNLTGLSNDAIQGKTPPEIVGDEIGAAIESRYRECIDRRETIQYPETIPVDGEQRHWETKLTPVVEDGTVVKLVGAMRDVTDTKERQRELELKQQVLDSVVSNAPVVFWTTDETGEFTRSRGQALGKLGLKPDEVVGESVFDVFESHPTSCDCVRRALAGEHVTERLRLNDCVFDAWFQPVHTDDGDSDNIIGTVGFAYDISQSERSTEEYVR